MPPPVEVGTADWQEQMLAFVERSQHAANAVGWPNMEVREMDKVRVYNVRKYSIGLLIPGGIERTIQPGSFALLTRDEIEYLASIAPTLFEGEKQLRLEDRTLAVQLGFVESAQAETLDADSIRKHLAQRVPQVKAWLDGI